MKVIQNMFEILLAGWYHNFSKQYDELHPMIIKIMVLVFTNLSILGNIIAVYTIYLNMKDDNLRADSFEIYFTASIWFILFVYTAYLLFDEKFPYERYNTKGDKYTTIVIIHTFSCILLIFIFGSFIE